MFSLFYVSLILFLVPLLPTSIDPIAVIKVHFHSLRNGFLSFRCVVCFFLDMFSFAESS
jgi:hypothetical protein